VIERLTRWRGGLPRAALLATCIAMIPLPAGAADTVEQGRPAGLTTPTVSPTVRNIKASMNTIVTREIRAARPVAAPRAQGSSPVAQSPGFFRTRTGAIVAAVMIAGTGYALYSTQHDRIHSPGKE
jgi:hypothetical protein